MSHTSRAPDDAISATTLVRRMGHDFNNLFSIVLGGLSLLREELPESAWDSGAVETYDDILSAASEAVDVMNQLIAWAGRQALAPRPTDLDAVARDLGALLERAMPEGITVITVLSGAQARARVDPARLQDALLELAANARDALPCGGTITLAASAGASPSISVADDGEGMTSTVVSRCTEPYFSTRENGARRGIGLSVVDGFVRASGGRLDIDSEPGAGTRITLHLPAS